MQGAPSVPVAGWIMDPPKQPCSNLWNLCYLVWQNVLGDVIKLGILRWGYYPGISKWVLNVITCPYKNKAKGDWTHREVRQHGHKGKGWTDTAISLGMLAPTRGWKRQMEIFPRSLMKDHSTAYLLILAQGKWCSLLASRIVWKIPMCCFKPPSLWWFVIKTTEHKYSPQIWKMAFSTWIWNRSRCSRELVSPFFCGWQCPSVGEEEWEIDPKHSPI